MGAGGCFGEGALAATVDAGDGSEATEGEGGEGAASADGGVGGGGAGGGSSSRQVPCELNDLEATRATMLLSLKPSDMTTADLVSQSGGPGWFLLLQRRYVNSSLKSQMLAQLGPLQTATKAFCNKLAEFFTLWELPADHFLYSKGEKPDHLYLLPHGSVKLLALPPMRPKPNAFAPDGPEPIPVVVSNRTDIGEVRTEARASSHPGASHHLASTYAGLIEALLPSPPFTLWHPISANHPSLPLPSSVSLGGRRGALLPRRHRRRTPHAQRRHHRAMSAPRAPSPQLFQV